MAKDKNGDLYAAGPHTMSDQLVRASEVIEAQPGRVVLVGHSFGGKAALNLARTHADKVSCVVGLAPSIQMLYAYWKNLTGERGLPSDGRIVEQRLKNERSRLEWLQGQAKAKNDKKAIRELYEALSYHGVMEDLIAFDEARVELGVTKPTLVIHGTEDAAVSVHYARRFAQARENPGVKLVEIPGVGHGFDIFRQTPEQRWVMDQRATDRVTTEVAAAISQFISEQR
jgi:pimeloyl-ACP methyl ester carboxylesterase